MGTGFSKKKKQAKVFQNQLQQMQDQIKDISVVGTAANGLVEITLNGESDVLSVKINPECVDSEDVEGLEDLIKKAFNDGQAKLKEASNMNLPKLGGGLPNIPGLSTLGL